MRGLVEVCNEHARCATKTGTALAWAGSAKMESDQVHALIEIGRGGVKMEASASPQGLLAISALVSGILLSTAVIVWASTAVPRKHPLIDRLPRG